MPAKGTTSAPTEHGHRLQELEWNTIEHPGAYLVVGTGSLARVPADALAAGHSPLISVCSIGETRVAKLSDNPSTPIST
ncbi:MAG: hypothetical protein ACC682_15505, partial [Gemmatimonadota bacterium]